MMFPSSKSKVGNLLRCYHRQTKLQHTARVCFVVERTRVADGASVFGTEHLSTSALDATESKPLGTEVALLLGLRYGTLLRLTIHHCDFGRVLLVAR
jgi:hypothetical protein